MTNSYPLEVNKSGAWDKDLALETTANHQIRETLVLAPGPGGWAPALGTQGSHLDPLLKNASGISLRTTSQKFILPRIPSEIILPFHPPSPLTLFGTWSFGLSYSFKPFYTGTLWARSKFPAGRVWVSKPYSPTGKPAGFECLLLQALGQETHSSRERDQSCLPKVPCTGMEWEMPLWEQRCQQIPHKTQEETSALPSFPHRDNLVAIHTHNCIPAAPWHCTLNSWVSRAGDLVFIQFRGHLGIFQLILYI